MKNHSDFGRMWLWLGIAALVTAVGVLIVGLLFIGPAHADGLTPVASAYGESRCQNVYNPMSGKWEYVCVERDRDDYRAPNCRQEYDPMNGRWVTVCD